MSNFKEIVTKAIIGKCKKKVISSYDIECDEKPNTILGCWVINHSFRGVNNLGKVNVSGSFDVNVWYSYDNDTKTAVTTRKFSYTDAIKKLEEALKNGAKFEFKPYWGCDIATEHERYLTEKIFGCPVMVYNYPKEIKSFYMKQNDDGKTVKAVDVLVPGIGELIGGSEREENYDKLLSACKERNMDMSAYQWYLDLRRFGTVPHSGFGLGFERLIRYVTGMENIRDVIPYPRAPKLADF